MKTTKHPRSLTDEDAEAIVGSFDNATDDGYVVGLSLIHI